MWARAAQVAAGIWLMAAPGLLGLGEPARTNDHVVGALAASLMAIAASEVTRPLRWVGVPLGAWLLLAPWLLGYGDAVAALSDGAAGVVLLALVPLGGQVRQRFGGGWSSLWSSRSDHAPRGTSPGAGPAGA